MYLHEFQAKSLFADYGIGIPRGLPAASAAEAREAAQTLGGDRWVVKAQVHAGGRGKAGGVILVKTPEEAEAAAGRLLGTQLVTFQTAGQGLPVDTVLVEEVSVIARELYLSCLVDRASERVLFMVSEAGGMDIEEVAAETPERIQVVSVDPAAGVQGYQCRLLSFGLGLQGEQHKVMAGIVQGLYRLLLEQDASQIEINPLVVTADGRLLALDAKLNLDDNALYAHPNLQALRDPAQEDERERAAREHELNFISLQGDIGCMVNGAGLAMATLDLIQLHGGAPANFLDVGGGTTAARVAEAFKLILSGEHIRAVLVNIFGGIVRGDLIAEGILSAVREVGVSIPVVVRLAGTNAAEGLALLAESGLAIQTAEDLDKAAEMAVQAARGV
jgi:succinyl-CoA synthetase beta subunit